MTFVEIIKSILKIIPSILIISLTSFLLLKLFKITDFIEKIIEKENLLKKLKSGKKLRIKYGIDPTGPKIHIGRAVQFRKLKNFQKLGHQIILIIGDFTAQIGDASDKQAMRKPLSEKEIKENMKDYEKQIGKILDMKKKKIF